MSQLHSEPTEYEKGRSDARNAIANTVSTYALRHMPWLRGAITMYAAPRGIAANRIIQSLDRTIEFIVNSLRSGAFESENGQQAIADMAIKEAETIASAVPVIASAAVTKDNLS